MNTGAFDFLSNLRPFSFLPEQDLKQLSSAISEENYEKDAVLSVQGKSEMDNVLIVKSGSLELFYDKGGKRILSGSIKQGEACNGMAILMNAGIAVRTAITGEDTSCYVVPKKTFTDICNRFEPFHDFFVKIYKKLMLDESYSSVMTAGQAYQFLSGVAPFSFLPDDEIEKTASQVFVAHYPKDTVLFAQGQARVEYLYIIQKGAAERYYEEEGNKNLKGVLSEGDMYGGISMLVNDGMSVRTLKLTEKSYFYILPKKNFFDICERHKAFSEYFTDTFGKRMLDRSYAAIVGKSMRARDDTPQFFNQPIESIYTKQPVFCEMDTSIQEAAYVMTRRKCSSIYVRDPDGDFVGIVTDNDLRKKVIAKGYDIEKRVSTIMTSPLSTIPAQSLIFEGLMSMMQENIKHLAVTDPNGKVVGAVTNHDLLIAQGQSPFFLLREISQAETRDEIKDKHSQLPGIIKNLIHSGAKAQNVTRLITTISDAVLKKLISFALDEMEPPPARFVFMIMGSEGRREQTLKTDQDNAILFEDVPKESEEEVRSYFLKFGEKVCTWLDEAGYDFCEGGIMAKNPKWCQPLSVWKEYFSDWIHTAQPEDLLQASIFFDFRGAHGDLELTDQLQEFLLGSLTGFKGFFRHLTENALHFKPPLGFFRNFVVESKGKHRNSFDIKSAMMPIVDFARVYALNNKIEETNTLERLNQLHIRKALNWKDYNEIEQAYSFLMQLRFVRQVTSVVEEGEKPDNYINPKKLSNIEQTMVKEIFKRIEKFQRKLDFDFIGTM